MGFGVWGLGFRVWGLGFRVWGLGFRVWGLGSMHQIFLNTWDPESLYRKYIKTQVVPFSVHGPFF